MTDNNINNNQGQYHKGSFTNYQKKDITYEINERLGIISEDMNGRTRELNLVSWNGGKAKFDLREWSPDHTRMSKGVSLTEEEMEKLVELFNTRDEEDSFE